MINPKSLIEMLESSYDGIWITDGNGRILFANSANASLLGVTKEDLMGKSTEELLEKKGKYYELWNLQQGIFRHKKEAPKPVAAAVVEEDDDGEEAITY